jgi:hypothetical protein
MSGLDKQTESSSDLETDTSTDSANSVINVEWEKTSWIYKLSKTKLQEQLTHLNIVFDDKLTVDGLRQLLVTYCKDKQKNTTVRIEKSTNMANLNLQPFNGNKYECFEQQLECYIKLNDVSEEKRTLLLLTKLTSEVFETVTCLCAPKRPIELSYVELTSVLKKKYVTQQSVSLERAAFRNRNQLSNENIEDYVLELKKLSSRCDFADPDDQIKEKIIDGVRS